MQFILKELHNYNGVVKGNYNAILSQNSNTTDYLSCAAINSRSYNDLFSKHKKSNRKLSVISITYTDKDGIKNRIWRECNTKGVTDLKKGEIALPWTAMYELGITGINKVITVDVNEGNWMMFYWHHPNHAARISTRVGVISLGVSIVSLILAIIDLIC